MAGPSASLFFVAGAHLWCSRDEFESAAFANPSSQEVGDTPAPPTSDARPGMPTFSHLPKAYAGATGAVTDVNKGIDSTYFVAHMKRNGISTEAVDQGAASHWRPPPSIQDFCATLRAAASMPDSAMVWPSTTLSF